MKKHVSLLTFNLIIILGSTMVGALSPETASAQLMNSTWPKFRGNLANTGQSPYNGPSTPVLLWSYSTEYPVLSSPAVGADGTVYVGSYDNKLYALNSTGSLR